MTEPRDDQVNPGQLVSGGVEECLALARTWHAWDGRPIPGTADGKPNTWTPHKALRRINDHLIDHLHEVEALLAGAEPIPDTWHGRFVTLDADWARSPSPTTTRHAPGSGGWPGGTYSGMRPPGRAPGTSRGQEHGRCARSLNTLRACGITPSRLAT